MRAVFVSLGANVKKGPTDSSALAGGLPARLEGAGRVAFLGAPPPQEVGSRLQRGTFCPPREAAIGAPGACWCGGGPRAAPADRPAFPAPPPEPPEPAPARRQSVQPGRRQTVRAHAGPSRRGFGTPASAQRRADHAAGLGATPRPALRRRSARLPQADRTRGSVSAEQVPPAARPPLPAAQPRRRALRTARPGTEASRGRPQKGILRTFPARTHSGGRQRRRRRPLRPRRPRAARPGRAPPRRRRVTSGRGHARAAPPR